ncbi:hypothetical protein KGO06_02395 [Patescibacteria group bacterium]|nr:hypothetical protein [Patescibacteria group bacterium]
MKTLLRVIILCVCLIGVGILASETGRAITAAARTRAEIMALSERDEGTQRAARFLSEQRATTNAIDAYVLDVDDVPRAIELIETAAKRARITASVGSLSAVPVGEYHDRLTVTVSVEGSRAVHERFIETLNSLPSASTIASISLQGTERGWFGTYTIAFVQKK